MTQELWIAVFAAIWGVVTCLASPVVAGLTSGKAYFQWNAGPRDKPFDIGPHADHLKRAFSNFMETYIFFAVLVICLAFAHKSSVLSVGGAGTYLIARIAYVPLYVFGVTGVRSIVWGIGLLGMALCAIALFL